MQSSPDRAAGGTVTAAIDQLQVGGQQHLGTAAGAEATSRCTSRESAPHSSRRDSPMPKPINRPIVALLAAAMAAAPAARATAAPAPAPIAVYPANPSYFEYRGKVTALLSSGEHYGSLINKDFDYRKYFAALAASNFTLTEAFAGSYVEPDDDGDPSGLYPLNNPLSPANGSYISPFARTAVPGGPKGGTKFDLLKYDPAYFSRLRSFVKTAGAAGVVVQLGLFCGYDAVHSFIWDGSPQNPKNNVNGWADVRQDTVYTERAGAAMLAAQLGMVTKLVGELKGEDNVLIELVGAAATPHTHSH